MASTLPRLPRLPVFEAIEKHDPDSVAVVHSLSGRQFTYGELLNDVAEAKDRLKDSAKGTQLDGERIAFLVENGYDYVVTLLAILGCHSIAVPLAPSFPANELRYIVEQSQALMLLSSSKFQNQAKDIVKENLGYVPILAELGKILEGDKVANAKLEDIRSEGNGGMMLYTSGTTSRPKGVLIPQSALTAQSYSLLKAWHYLPTDRLLHCLPLHHIHGTVNALLTPLFAGSTIEFLFPFNTSQVWARLAAPFLHDNTDTQEFTLPREKITFFTAVPTIYSRLLNTHASLTPEIQHATTQALSPQNLRLNISGSAALPTPTKKKWANLSFGNVLLERYGMTEVGMALSCGLDFSDRVDGSVGWPLPGVEARLVDTDNGEIIQEGQEIDVDGRERHGEIQLRGKTIFKEYWRNEAATVSEFVDGEDGKGKWFKTGDVAVRRNVERAGEGRSGEWARGSMYFIQGRKSADIIKTGGEKVSALEVEREMLSLPQISECAVVPLPSRTWGQRVASVVVLTSEGKNPPEQSPSSKKKGFSALDLRRALKDKLANYKIPQEMKIVESIPRNAMGKINKRQLVKEVWGDDPGSPEREA
ncbi:acetyl-CoA synthetase-like protein [Patellaria atrata CBS 101060]|uniref:Acetyl-CoA synthetase-like protein n=1 Tax=Patellaria atrata CBS 101060 TaxID=1346257 RepID=A0A9P4SDJ8_9PEZI|nr:acetyl-CoA synthetase-like protein [Patellaria atrata CBS 101060]